MHDPDFALKSKYQHRKLWCMANKIHKNKKILYVCFEVNRKNIFNLSFCLVILNAPKNNQRFDEMARKSVKMCLLLFLFLYILFAIHHILRCWYLLFKVKSGSPKILILLFSRIFVYRCHGNIEFYKM